MAPWLGRCTTSPPPPALTPTGTPSSHRSRLHRATMSSHTPSPSTRRSRRTPLVMPCPLPLRRRFRATTSPAPAPHWRSTCLPTTRACRTTYRRSGPRCSGSISMKCCRGWRSRGAGWCSTQREFSRFVLSLLTICYIYFRIEIWLHFTLMKKSKIKFTNNAKMLLKIPKWMNTQ